MKYKLYNNSTTGMHCVQACLQMLLYSFDLPVLSLQELDHVTHHEPEKYTWMGDAMLWLSEQGVQIESYENLDYIKFVGEGEDYLRTIWSKNTFQIQSKHSDLRRERLVAKKMLDKDICLVNARLSVEGIKQKYNDGYFVMLSVNPFALEGIDDYGSHLVVIGGFEDQYALIYDPDKPNPQKVHIQLLEYAISESKKNDFNAIFFKK